MIVAGPSISSTRVEKRESGCPYCGSQMSEGTCPQCGSICPRCGTPTKEPTCPQCGHGSFLQGYSPTGSPAPAQSPELSDVQRILGRTPSRREFYMVRGLVDRDRERIHRVTELLCERFPAPIGRELIEMRALQVRNKASKDGSALTHAESVVFAFLEAARHSGMMDSATKALAETQLSDANLRLGLSKARLPPLKFIVDVSGVTTSAPLLLVDGSRRSCKTVQLEAHAHGRAYLLIWRPLLADCLGQDAGSPARRVSAAIEGDSGLLPLKVAWRDSPDEKSEHIDVVLDPQRSFYGFTTRKEIEVDIGLPAPRPADTDAGLMLKKMTKQLDNLRMTTMLFRIAYGTTPSGATWSKARKIIAEPTTVLIAVTPRKKAAAALIAADMRHFAELGDATRAMLMLQVQKVPLDHRGAIYTCEMGLIVPSEFSTATGVEWADALSLAVKL